MKRWGIIEIWNKGPTGSFLILDKKVKMGYGTNDYQEAIMVIILWYSGKEGVVCYQPRHHKRSGKFLYFIDGEKETLLLGEVALSNDREVWNRYIVFRGWLKEVRSSNKVSLVMFNEGGQQSADFMIKQLRGAGIVDDTKISAWDGGGFNVVTPDELKPRIEKLLMQDNV